MMEDDINSFLFGQDDWREEDFVNNLLKMDDTMLFGEPPANTNGVMGELDDIMRQLSYSCSNEMYFGEQQVTSPLSSHCSSDQDFHGFPSVTDGSSSTSLDGYFDDVCNVRLDDSLCKATKLEPINEDFCMLNVLKSSSPEEEQEAISSAASDSGLSSDHLDLDPNTEYDALSPSMSSPGPSVSERGGQNSPPRYTKSIQLQPPAVLQTIPQSVSSTVSIVPQPAIPVQPVTVEPRLNKILEPCADPKRVTKTLDVSASTANFTPLATKTSAKLSSAPVYQNATIKSVVGGVGTKRISSPQQIVANGKELKIIRMATTKNGQTVAVANGLASVGSSNKKVTLQLKNSAAGIKTSGTMIPKNVVFTTAPAATGNNGGVSGMRNVIRVQQPRQPNGRPILVPVTFQDLRTIKIVNSTSLKNKSANIKQAAANMLQQSKQGLIQKHVVLSKDQLLVDDNMSDVAPSCSDSESYVFEDIIQQSNSVIAEVERQQKQIISDSDVEPDGDDGDDDDDMGMDEIPRGTNRNGTYQKLMLTVEEKRLLAKEGISLPTSYPLTKHEERELKRIRRKIRNKISAQDSRKRKKEYVDGLEERVKQCTEENQNLVKRMKILQSQNQELANQVKRFQSLLTKGTSKTTQPATCLMVLLISMALVAVPNLKLGNTATQQNIQDSIEVSELMQDQANDKLQVQQSRRSLLFDTKEQMHANEEELTFDEIMSSFNANSLIANEHDYFSEGDGRTGNGATYEPRSAKRAKLMATALVDYDVDDKVWNGGSKIRIKQEDGSMSPDSSSSSAMNSNELFEQKVREFQEKLQKSVGLEQNDVNYGTPFVGSGVNSEVIIDRELLDLGGKGDNGLYELNTFSSLHEQKGDGMGGIDLLGVGSDSAMVRADSTADNAADVRKLNASQQIQQQNNKRKLLL
ncbi:uncharacterized protein LOC128721800 [Anopheles nili]|uniref:uncharacterized protein LOC128721800 n=1 Tax=Anopheles nili TaxID=185578 RepID=UPI00237B6D21|nr:uncharacterized protein LOC128721800 [Anopheles nili]